MMKSALPPNCSSATRRSFVVEVKAGQIIFDPTALSPRQYQYRLPYRLNRSLPNSPRLLSRCTTHSTTPVSKSVRISTQSIPSHTIHCRSRSTSRPLESILRHSSAHG
ncbi:unnamed protein product, partial [Rotaria sp. Silwood1]